MHLLHPAGVRSGVVHSKRSIEEVNLDISRFRRGDLDVLWNCEKLTEVCIIKLV
jgi:hypothetical protein